MYRFCVEETEIVRVLTTDVRDNSLVVCDTSSIYVDQNIAAYHTYSNNCIKEWQFTSILAFEDHEDKYFIILDSIEEANSFIRKAYNEDIVDLSMYGDRTFVNPDENDADAIDVLFKRLEYQD